MPNPSLKRALTLGALSLVLLSGAACGDDKEKTQKGQVDTTSTTSPATTSTTSAPATTTTAAPTTTTTVKAPPTTATPTTATTQVRTVATAPEVYYPNCTAVKDAGAAPISQGQPGYGLHLDRDKDGIACDK